LKILIDVVKSKITSFELPKKSLRKVTGFQWQFESKKI